MGSGNFENYDATLSRKVQPLSATSAAASFAAILDLILTTLEGKLIDRSSNQALRLTCKATRRVVDFHVKTCSNRSIWRFYWDDEKHASLSEPAQWPWPNLTEIRFKCQDPKGDGIKRRELEHLVSLPIKKLESLELVCCDLVPLIDSHWPMLTSLKLRIRDPLEDEEVYSYPNEFQFPTWPLLKKLDIQFQINHKLSFFGPLLKSCPELTHFGINVDNHQALYIRKSDLELATIFSLAPLTKLESLVLASGPLRFLSLTIYERRWQSLKHLELASVYDINMSLLASKPWTTQLESFVMRRAGHLIADDLRTFLQVLEKGNAMKKLELRGVHHDVIIQGFKGIKLGNLEQLRLHKCCASDPNVIDASNSINLLFESCLFPKLKEIDFSSNYYFDDIDEPGTSNLVKPAYNQPPSASIDRLVRSFPLLKKIILSNLDVSLNAAEYLRRFREQTGCQLEFKECIVADLCLSRDNQQLLYKLGINLEKWCRFYNWHFGKESSKDCFVWGTMSQLQFKRIAYATGLEESTMIYDLDCILKLIEAEGEGRIMAANVLESLRKKMSEYSHIFCLHQLTWGNVDSLINFKMKGPSERKRNLSF